jgi:hypothetical protein
MDLRTELAAFRTILVALDATNTTFINVIIKIGV